MDTINHKNNSVINCDISALKDLRTKNPTNVILSYININSARYKLNMLEQLTNKFVDVLVIAETKLDESFPTNQFLMESFKTPYRLDINSRSGGLLVYVNLNIPSRILKPKHTFPKNIQAITVELNLKKQKWLIVSIYRPPSQDAQIFSIAFLRF